MLKTSLAVLLSLCALVGACKKKEAAPPVTGPSATERPIPPPPAAGPSLAEAKLLLTEDKLTRFLRFQTELVAANAEATKLALAAQQAAGSAPKKVEQAMTADNRAERLAEANKAALAGSGLSQDEANRLSRILTPYYGRLFAMHSGLSRTVEMRARAAEAAARGASDKTMEKLQAEQAARMDAIRKDFGERYGTEGLALVQKHEADFFPIHEQMLGPALRGMRRPPDRATTPTSAPPPAPKP